MPNYTCMMFAAALFWACAIVAAAGFQDLGVPVRKAGYKGVLVGPNSDDTKDLVYFNFMQNTGKLFLLCVDPDTGQTQQYDSPKESGGWAFILGPDNKVYIGTFGQGLILRFDPKQPDKGICVVGRPSKTESYIWQFANGTDGKIYGCTYPQAKLVSYDPKTDQMADLGRMDDTEFYTRTIAAGPNGKVYLGIGPAKQNLVVYDPSTREHRSLIPMEWRVSAFLHVTEGGDGNAYARVTLPPDDKGRRVTKIFRLEDEKLVEAKRVPGKSMRLRDGRFVSSVTMAKDGGQFTVTDPRTKSRRQVAFHYRGAGCGIFVVGAGPSGCIYGSTAMPLEVFRHDPRAGKSDHLGNMPGGEVYSMIEWEGKLYLCYYGGSVMNLYDPSDPQWHWGSRADCNPRCFGGVGDGHLRPRAMIYGPGRNIYIGSHPAYGQLGGAMAVWDPKRNRTVENYRHLIKDQSIVALAYEPTSGLIFGGSGNCGGGGTRPTQKEALFFAFDPAQKRKVLSTPLVPGAQTYQAMCAAQGKVFVAVNEQILVYDPADAKVVHKAKLPGKQVEISLGLHTDGLIYGLTSTAVYSVDPKTFVLKTVAKPKAPISCGFAVTETGVYFGSGVHLWRYAW